MNELSILALLAAMASGFVLSELRRRQANPDHFRPHDSKEGVSDSGSPAKWM